MTLALLTDIAMRKDFLYMGLAMLIPLFVWAFIIVQHMIHQDIDLLTGFVALAVGIILLQVTQTTPHKPLAFACATVAILLAPSHYLITKLWNRHQDKTFDGDLLRKLHATIKLNQTNLPAKFRLAETLWDIGMRGHAYGYAATLLPDMNPYYFSREHQTVKKWFSQLGNEDLAPIQCKKCGLKNPPGDIYCSRCKCEYLLLSFTGSEGVDHSASQPAALISVIALLLIGVPAAVLMQLDPIWKIVMATLCLAAAIWVLFANFIRKEPDQA